MKKIRRTLKYLEFLKGGGNVDEGYKSVFDNDTLNNNSGNLVYKILGIDPIERSYTRTPNVILNHRWRPNSRDYVIPEENEEPLNEGITKLLLQEDMRGEKRKKKFHHHVKRITRSSKNLFNDKLITLKNKSNDGNNSLNSSTSDISYSESIRSSLTDLRSLIKFKLKKKNDSNINGAGMASLLVNSIMHGPNLDSISEGNSIRSTPSQNMKFRKDIKSESEGAIKKPNLRRQIAIPQDSAISSSSVSSSTTGEEEEEGFSDDETSEVTTPNEIVVVDADTVSMVVKTVLAQEENDQDSNNWIHPGSTQDDDENDETEEISRDKSSRNELNSIKQQKSIDLEQTLNSTGGKFCIPTGAVRISKKGKQIESEIITKNTDPIELGKILKEPSYDEDADNWIQPGSTTDEPETVDERRGSLLHEIKENLSETFHQIQVR